MPRRYDAVFFDMGFTLVDFYPSLQELTWRAFHEAGVAVSAEQLMSTYRAVSEEIFRDSATATFEASEAFDNAREREYRRRILARLGIEDENTLRRLREREAAVYTEPGAIRLYPEVRAVLQQLRAEGYRLGIISNWSWNLRQRCQQVGITAAFDLILASAYAGAAKPNPVIFQKAAAELRVRPERAIHVGDDYRADVLGARNAGLAAVLIYRGDGAPQCDCPVIHNLEELLPILESGQAQGIPKVEVA